MLDHDPNPFRGFHDLVPRGLIDLDPVGFPLFSDARLGFSRELFVVSLAL